MTTENQSSSGMEPKTIAMISYLTLVGLIIAFVLNNEKKDELASFHIRQMVGLFVISFGLFVFNIIPILGQILWLLGSLALFLLWIIGFMGAVNGEKKEVPILGAYFQKWFSGI